MQFAPMTAPKRPPTSRPSTSNASGSARQNQARPHHRRLPCKTSLAYRDDCPRPSLYQQCLRRVLHHPADLPCQDRRRRKWNVRRHHRHRPIPEPLWPELRFPSYAHANRQAGRISSSLRPTHVEGPTPCKENSSGWNPMSGCNLHRLPGNHGPALQGRGWRSSGRRLLRQRAARIPGLRFETPQPQPKVTNHIVEPALFRPEENPQRFSGTLYTFVSLDANKDIYPRSRTDFDVLLKSLVIDSK